MTHRSEVRAATGAAARRGAGAAPWLLASLVVWGGLLPLVARAQNTTWVQVRITNVSISDDGDSGDGEIQYAAVAATGNHGQEPLVVQTTSFPFEKWYEAEVGGANANFMTAGQQGMPVFNFPESEMGDSLVVGLAVLDNDENPNAVQDAHRFLAPIGAGVATWFVGPAGGAFVKLVADGIQHELDNDSQDLLGVVSIVHGRGDRFGTGATGTTTNTVQSTNGKVTVTYNVRRTRTTTETSTWCVRARLAGLKIIGDGDSGLDGDGEIYVRARTADGYTASRSSSVLQQRPTRLPQIGTRDVESGRYFRVGEGVELYSNGSGGRCRGIPPFLFLEVDVLEADDTSDDDVLGVLPIMLSAGWLRENQGRREITYRMRGADPNEKVEITLVVEVEAPSVAADPDGPLR